MSGEDFDAHYGEIFGPRWSPLRAALLATQTRLARVNAFHPNPQGALPEGAQELLPGCFAHPRLIPPRGDAPLPYYLMDGASVLAARALQVRSGDRVLDLCAAPGGKTLVLAEALAESGSLTSNDSSRRRVERLRDVVSAYLPDSVRARIRITGFDASRWGMHEPESYDRVLVDAPCSSEAHVLADPKALAAWSAARPRQLAIRQGALLAAAIDSAASGARVVYSTCALDPRENDGVVQKLLKKRRGRVELAEPPEGHGEATDCGRLLLPDRTGLGPIYFAALRKL